MNGKFYDQSEYPNIFEHYKVARVTSQRERTAIAGEWERKVDWKMCLERNRSRKRFINKYRLKRQIRFFYSINAFSSHTLAEQYLTTLPSNDIHTECIQTHIYITHHPSLVTVQQVTGRRTMARWWKTQHNVTT